VEEIKNWMTSPDGDDYCCGCWGKYLKKFTPEQRIDIKKNSTHTSELVEYRKASDGYFILCEGCNKTVSWS
jgi:hypothetical protein